MTRFLKFESEDQAKEILAVFISDGGWLTASHAHSLDPVGVIYRPTGETTETEDGVIPVYKAIDGYHVNFIGEMTTEQQAFEVFPNTPSQVFS